MTNHLLKLTSQCRHVALQVQWK